MSLAPGTRLGVRSCPPSFGVVLYEMLAGRSCFGKETVSDTVAAVPTTEPDWERIPTPARRLLALCLEKDPKRRLRDIGDTRFMIDDGGGELKSRTWIPWSVAGLLAAAGLGLSVLDLAPDGKRFAIVPDSSASPAEVRVTVLLNFFDELRRRIP